MKPIRKNILVAVNTSEKDDYAITLPSGLRLFMRSNYGFDGKQTAPVMAKVIEVSDCIDDIFPGDIVLTHFNAFRRNVADLPNGKPQMLGDTGEKLDGLSLFSVERSMVFIRLSDTGDPLPLKDILIVDRIPVDVDTTLHVPDSAEATKECEFRVVAVGEDCDGLVAGTTIIAYKHSDLQINYTWNEQLRQCYRVKAKDVLAVLN